MSDKALRELLELKENVEKSRSKTLHAFLKLKETVEKCQRKADRAEGVCDQLLNQLQKEYGCDSLEAAKAKVAKLKTKQVREEKEAKERAAEFEEKFGAALEAYE